MKDVKLKICVGYHKPSFLLNGDCFVPMWGGKAVSGQVSKDGKGLQETEYQWMKEHCIGDDTGDNISDKNRNYCEATYLYWMWKNYKKLGNPEYIGFLQYRRHFVLNDEYYKEHYEGNIHNLIIEDEFSLDHQYKIGLIEKNLLNVINSYDGIFCVNDTKETVYHYKQHHHSQDIKYWDKTLEIIEKDWPQYADAAREYNNGTWHAWSNCFIMKREDFLEYCPFLFDVLAKIDKFAEPEYENMTVEQMRVPAYVSETMLGIWWVYKKNQGRKFKSLPLLYIKKPFDSLCSLPQYIEPVFKNAVPVVFIADENYVKYTAVAIESLIQNASEKNNYDIIILHDGCVSEKTQQRIINMQTKNVSIRFFNASYYIQKYNFAEFFHRRLNTMPYLKLFIHEILHDYDRAIFLDGDMVIVKNIAELYNQSLNENMIGGCQDVIAVHVKSDYWDYRRNYIVNNNKMLNINKFINTGVLLLDLAKMRNTQELINRFINEARFKQTDRYYHDQDVFNFVLENKIKLLPQKFNLNYFLYFPRHMNKVPSYIREEFLTTLQNKDIYILHYNGNPKPWQTGGTNDYLSNIWWKYARQTPFYEEFLQKIFANNVTYYKFNEISKLKRKYQTHRLLSHITFGKLRDKQNERKLNYRKILDNM